MYGDNSQSSSRKREELEERLLEFASRIGRVVDALPSRRLGAHIAKQLVRSGTSPVPNYAEACAAESRKDFIHKLRVVLKELRETSSWLRLIMKCKLIPVGRIQNLLDESVQLSNIIGKSIVTAKNGLKPPDGPDESIPDLDDIG